MWKVQVYYFFRKKYQNMLRNAYLKLYHRIQSNCPPTEREVFPLSCQPPPPLHHCSTSTLFTQFISLSCILVHLQNLLNTNTAKICTPVRVQYTKSQHHIRSYDWYSHAPHNNVSVKGGPHTRIWSHNIIILKEKQSHYRPGETLRVAGIEALRFQDNRHMKMVRLLALSIGRLYPQEIFLVLISVSWVNPRAIVRPEGLCQWKISMTLSGIEPDIDENILT
jgi:hypothetical protein